GNIDLKNARDFADTIIATIREALIVLNSNLRIELANRAFYDLFKLNTDQTEGQLLYEIADRELNIPELRHELDELVKKDKMMNDFEIEQTFSRIGHKHFSLKARKLIRKSGREPVVLLMF